jgi:uncharacterized NAD-dependent epimerase/dehydratase family protein
VSIERSIERDVKAMSMGLDVVMSQILMLSGNVKLRKAERKRLSRLEAIRKQMVENPDECKKLVKRYREMK